MSNKIPDFLQALIPHSQHLRDAATGGISGIVLPPHISIRGNRFTLVDEQGHRTPLREVEIDVVIVDANPIASRLYYSKPYEPDVDQPPDCFSDNGQAPSAQAISPQHANCAGCPQAVWGSAISKLTQKGIPACQERKKLAVLYENEPYMFVVPPGSLGAWRDYNENKINRAADLQLNMIVTRIGFAENTNGVLTFTAHNWIDKETLPQVLQIVQQPELTLKLTGKDDKPLTNLERIKPANRPANVVPMHPPGQPGPVESRIHTMAPTPPLQPAPLSQQALQQMTQPAPAAPPRKRKVAGGLTGEVIPPQPAAPPANGGPTSFGMTEAPAAVASPDLQSALSEALKFAK